MYDMTSSREAVLPSSHTSCPNFSRAPAEHEQQHSSATTGPLRSSGHKSWTLGILADKETDEVPGTVLLLSKFSAHNIPLGLQHERTGRSGSRGSTPVQTTRRSRSQSDSQPLKKTKDGTVILVPQPDDSDKDPLNWPSWRRDAALLSLGFYCMLGGGMTPILAAGFNNVATTFQITYAEVARTTGYYMLGLGLGSVVWSPTAILYGKRPVYLTSAVLFVATSIWCAAAPNYANLAVARVFQGVAVSPVECLPSATIAEIFFLHERAFRIGIYTLLLLGGKNLVPLVSAVIIQALGWRWVFYIVAMIVAFGGLLLFFFVPETFWDRTPRPRRPRSRSTSRLPSITQPQLSPSSPKTSHDTAEAQSGIAASIALNDEVSGPILDKPDILGAAGTIPESALAKKRRLIGLTGLDGQARPMRLDLSDLQRIDNIPIQAFLLAQPSAVPHEDDPTMPTLHNLNSPYYVELEKNHDYLDFHGRRISALDRHGACPAIPMYDSEKDTVPSEKKLVADSTVDTVNSDLSRENASWRSSLKIWNGRLSDTNWLKAMARPFLLFAYPAVLWSAIVYSLSVGWLIVLSESVSAIYISRSTYNFNSLQVGLVYISPFVGGILGTAVAGRVSDILVRHLARRNNGTYEPEFRLLMTVPILITTVAGLIGFGWSASARDNWIVPTLFFGLISFGCSLGSTTAITFCLDSYRQYANEALVTLNFSKNILHGLVFSLFFPQWLEAEGSKNVFAVLGAIQVVFLLLTVPMYIYGKRARMWTVRRTMRL